MNVRRIPLLGMSVWLVGLAGTAVPAETPTLDERLEPLRSAFNAEPDHVRAVLLVGPT